MKTTETTINDLRSIFTDRLHLHVIGWLEDRAKDYDGDLLAVCEDVMRGGCASGIVSDLIYYEDTTAFHDKFEDEIADLVEEMGYEDLPSCLLEMGLNVTQIKNALAWFGFETAIYNIHAQLEQL